jgi:hypothetical protein
MIRMTKRVVEEVYSVNSPSFDIALLRNMIFSTVLYVCEQDYSCSTCLL